MGKEDLLDAARNGNIELVGRILEQITRRSGPLSIFPRSINLNGQDMNGYTALHHACLNGHTNVVRLLLAHDAIADMPDIRGSTPLYLAAWAGHQEIVKMLLMHPQRPGNPNAQTIENETPLHCAAQHGHNTVLSILLAYRADPSIRNNSFRTALDLAAEFGRFEAVRMLIRTHPELLNAYRVNRDPSPRECSSPFLNNTPTPTKHIFTHTCLHLASRNGHKRVVQLLLDAGVDPNILTHAGSALHEAALCGKKSVVSILLQAGVDPQATDGNGRTALDLLNDYPPHVTYEIATAINEFCHSSAAAEAERVFKPITDSDSASSVQDLKRLMPKPTKPVVRSLGSLITAPSNHRVASNQGKPTAAYYLPMKPIPWQSTATGPGDHARTHEDEHSDSEVLAYKPVYKQPYLSSFTTPWRSRHKDGRWHENAAEGPPTNSTSSLERPRFVPVHQRRRQDFDGPPAARGRGSYVEMAEPSDEDEVVLRRRPTPSTTPEAAPRGSTNGDYANINNLTKSPRIHGEHSPTPEFPPPSVNEAEQTIIEFMQPVSQRHSNNNSRRHSIQIEERSDFSVEALVRGVLDGEPLGSGSARSSRISDCVEEFVGDGAPFAGLFKGSTLNLAGEDECDGGDRRPSFHRLRSPSLVRSVRWSKREAPKGEANDDYNNNNRNNNNNMNNNNNTNMNNINNNLKADSPAAGADESTDETKVWEEINSILESIGHEMFPDEQSTMPTSPLANSNNTLSKQRSVQIRQPNELLLTSSKENGSASWCHSTNTLIYGQVLYEVFYLGSTVIKELYGTVSTRKSIQKLKRGETPFASDVLGDCSNSTKYLKANNEEARLKVGLALSHIGVRFIDDVEKNTICIHDIENINCVCQDAEDLRYFAYITKEREMHYCHVFMVDCVELATEIILTLGQAFEVAYQLALAGNNPETDYDN